MTLKDEVARSCLWLQVEDIHGWQLRQRPCLCCVVVASDFCLFSKLCEDQKITYVLTNSQFVVKATIIMLYMI